mmetsp:Transcript_3745/g.11087  ORF Transcript_3745/g.11087 Transcript_3745/m.11087 type:complete len:262 (-) Transcript_3745:75-860(-)|eukprot:CAMPEP_0119260936 /NCGR_PEP_ID=MMETSP1329-20130426/1152_1 /TAXON_ID=114041 /ORGANISM="Genus nov. species nov., Strain RCC1024" /LENGTH=261 /DNA_ID=CAMNT_0007260413 /DNA_START=110 /DNA_END=895 /DNA_ORIENTATION=+
MNVVGDGYGDIKPDGDATTKRGESRPPAPQDPLRNAFTDLVGSTSSLSAYKVYFGMNVSDPFEGKCSNCGTVGQVRKIPEWRPNPHNVGNPEGPVPQYLYACEMRRLDRQNARLGKPLVAHLVHKDNKGEVTACCCPGVFQNIQWDVALEDNAWVVTDALFNFNRYNTHDIARDRINNEMARVQGIVGQLKAKYDRDEAGGVEPAAMARPAADAPAPAPAEAEAEAPAEDVVDKLKELAELRAAGVLTSDEFDRAKAKLLA